MRRAIMMWAVLLAAGCGSRPAEDRVVVGAHLYDRVYRTAPVGPTYGMVLVRHVPGAIYEAGGVQITGGRRAYLVQPNAWALTTELATTDSAVAEVNSAIDELFVTVLGLEDRIVEQRQTLQEQEAALQDMAEREAAVEVQRQQVREERHELFLRQQRLQRRFPEAPRRWSTRPETPEQIEQEDP